MDFYKRALELKDETVADRRYIHQNAETGLELSKTKAYVMDKLKEYGLDPVECGEGSSPACRYGWTSDAGGKW